MAFDHHQIAKKFDLQQTFVNSHDCILSNHKWNKICCRYECNINMINYGLVLTVSKQLSYSQLNDQ